MRIRSVAPLVLLVSATLAWTAPPASAPAAGEITAPVTGGSRATAAPDRDFAFTDMTGAAHRLSEFRGHPVLLEFWASWCVPCRKGFPFLDEIQNRYVRSGLKVVAVTLEPEEDFDAVRRFVADYPGSFLVGRDPSGRAGEIWQVAVMPTAFLLDAEGAELARFEGGTEEVHDRIEKCAGALARGEPIPQLADAKRREGPKGNLRAWERGYLADPIMSLDGDTLTRMMREHIHSSKEAAAGDGGVAGGGCGCN